MMRTKLGLGVVVTLIVGTAVVLGRANQTTAERMVDAAKKFNAGLSEDLRAKANFDFDDEERINWHFIPRERKGVPVQIMSKEQRELAKELLASGTSAGGYKTALGVMTLESVLRQLEDDAGTRRFPRDPLLYYFSIFGKPASTGTWGWRIEGHHLCLNYVLRDGKIVSATPTFFGANPAKVLSGDKKGLRTLPKEEDLARSLYKSLAGEARTNATLAENAMPEYREVLSGTQNARPEALPNKGVRYADLDQDQKDTLKELVHVYARRQPDEIARAIVEEIRQAGPDNVRFAWAGSPEPGEPGYYRVQGPSFLIEFTNTQNNANHIHSLLRRKSGEFGLSAAE